MFIAFMHFNLSFFVVIFGIIITTTKAFLTNYATLKNVTQLGLSSFRDVTALRSRVLIEPS